MNLRADSLELTKLDDRLAYSSEAEKTTLTELCCILNLKLRIETKYNHSEEKLEWIASIPETKYDTNPEEGIASSPTGAVEELLNKIRGKSGTKLATVNGYKVKIGFNVPKTLTL